MIGKLKYISAVFLLLNLPSFALVSFGSTMGVISSALSFALLIIYAIVAKRFVLLKIFLAIGLSYFLVAGIQFHSGIEDNYIAWFQKYMLVILFGAALAEDITKKELLLILLIGASSIVVNAVFFSDDYGRYSGFYLDPNAAGSVCITGYALTFAFEKSRKKTLAQFLFTFAGLITFSRTFVVLWIIINLFSLRLNPKNLKIFIMGFAVIILTISVAQLLNFNPVRFNQLKSLVGEGEVTTQELNEGSRTGTWAIFYPYIWEKPVVGHGFGSFQGGNQISRIGPHNSFILVWGEAGILAFLIFLGFHLYLLIKSFKSFREKPYLFMMSIGLVLFLLTNHNYFTAYYLLLYSMWIYIELQKPIEDEN